MDAYDPLEVPDPAEWLALDEYDRIELVVRYHLRERERLPDLRVHAVIHAIVENQNALGDEIPVRRTLMRLMEEGLTRHEALHAVGGLLAEHMFDSIKEGTSAGDPNERYRAALENLTAKNWRHPR